MRASNGAQMHMAFHVEKLKGTITEITRLPPLLKGERKRKQRCVCVCVWKNTPLIFSLFF